MQDTGYAETLTLCWPLLVERKRRLNKRLPFLEWQFLRMRHNLHEIERAEEMAKEIGVDNIAFGTIVLPFGINDARLAEEWFPEDELKDRIRYDMQDSDMKGRCWWLWRAAIFNWDGSVYPCCYVDEKEAVLGSISKDPFKDIWNNHALYIGQEILFTGGR